MGPFTKAHMISSWEHFMLLQIHHCQYGTSYLKAYHIDKWGINFHPQKILITGGNFDCPGVDWSSGSLVDSIYNCNLPWTINSASSQLYVRKDCYNANYRKQHFRFMFYYSTWWHWSIVPGFSDNEAVVVELANLLVTKISTFITK